MTFMVSSDQKSKCTWTSVDLSRLKSGLVSEGKARIPQSRSVLSVQLTLFFSKAPINPPDVGRLEVRNRVVAELSSWIVSTWVPVHSRSSERRILRARASGNMGANSRVKGDLISCRWPCWSKFAVSRTSLPTDPPPQ